MPLLLILKLHSVVQRFPVLQYVPSVGACQPDLVWRESTNRVVRRRNAGFGRGTEGKIETKCSLAHSFYFSRTQQDFFFFIAILYNYSNGFVHGSISSMLWFG